MALCAKKSDDTFDETILAVRLIKTVKLEYSKLLDKLLELGANVNVKDLYGYTPLHYATGVHSNETTLKLARTLIDAGAHVNALDRWGTTPLLSLMDDMPDFDEDAVHLLLQSGADPDIKNITGSSAG